MFDVPGYVALASTGALRRRLREATRTEHDSIEEYLGLKSGMVSSTEYRWLLKSYFGFYQPLELELARLDWRPCSIDMSTRCKTDWLASDLDDLGLDCHELESLPRFSKLSPFVSLYDGLGALYVVEGATLGGQQLMSRLGPALGISASYGGRFLSSYGRSTGQMWRSFVCALEEAGRNSDASAAIERSARATFANFHEWLVTSKEHAGQNCSSSVIEPAG